jgi:guanylate kinase
MPGRGRVFIVSAPSGSGKSTLVTQLLEKVPDLGFSISYTTRKPRRGERNGVEYFFVTEAVFDEMLAAEQFVEHARVFDHSYGTARHDLEATLARGKDVLLDIDTEGASQVKVQIVDAVSIFIMPPSYEALHERLDKRQLDNKETIQKRLRWASEVEVHRFKNYDYIVVNEDLTRSVELMCSIIWAERCRTQRMTEQVEQIIKTFGGIRIDNQHR